MAFKDKIIFMRNLINKRKTRVPVPFKPFKKAFTLIELLVWVSISVMLMLSVSIFVSSGMKNIMDENKVLENSWDFNEFSSAMQESLNLTWSWKTIKRISSTGVLFKRNQYFDKWGFTYIWEKEIDKFYCMSGSESTRTNHLIMKTFVPFEEQGENMFSTAWSYDKIFTATVWAYKSYALDNVVKKNWNIIIWKEIYWDKFKGWDFGTWVYLNNPTGLALSWSNILFVSDTLNNRVLYYNIFTKKIYTLLDEYDWLSEPTGLYYNAWKLYIANSWKWEILEYSSPKRLTNPNLNIVFTWWTVNNINNFEIDFFSWVTLNWPTNTWSYTFNWITKYVDFATWSTNNIKYYFSDYMNPSSSSIVWCTTNKTTYFLSLLGPTKDIISWCNGSTWTLITYYRNKFTDFNNWNKINITWISPLLSNTWTYYVDLKLYNWTTLKYQKYYPYFTQWDRDILTPADNTLKVFTGGLNYPTWLWWNLWLKYKEFLKTWRNLNKFWLMDYNKQSDYILKTPLKSLSIDYPSNLLTIFIKYYKNYNCYNLEDNAQRSYIIKKKF